MNGMETLQHECGKVFFIRPALDIVRELLPESFVGASKKALLVKGFDLAEFATNGLLHLHYLILVESFHVKALLALLTKGFGLGSCLGEVRLHGGLVNIA